MTEIVIHFKTVPHSMFHGTSREHRFQPPDFGNISGRKNQPELSDRTLVQRSVFGR